MKIKYELSQEDLVIPDKLDIIRIAFFDPECLRAAQTTEEVTKEEEILERLLELNLERAAKDS